MSRPGSGPPSLDLAEARAARELAEALRSAQSPAAISPALLEQLLEGAQVQWNLPGDPQESRLARRLGEELAIGTHDIELSRLAEALRQGARPSAPNPGLVERLVGLALAEGEATPPVSPLEADQLAGLLRSATEPASLDASLNDLLLTQALEDPLAAPNLEELAESARLREALEGRAHPEALPLLAALHAAAPEASARPERAVPSVISPRGDQARPTTVGSRGALPRGIATSSLGHSRDPGCDRQCAGSGSFPPCRRSVGTERSPGRAPSHPRPNPANGSGVPFQPHQRQSRTGPFVMKLQRSRGRARRGPLPTDAPGPEHFHLRHRSRRPRGQVARGGPRDSQPH